MFSTSNQNVNQQMTQFKKEILFNLLTLWFKQFTKIELLTQLWLVLHSHWTLLIMCFLMRLKISVSQSICFKISVSMEAWHCLKTPPTAIPTANTNWRFHGRISTVDQHSIVSEKISTQLLINYVKIVEIDKKTIRNRCFKIAKLVRIFWYIIFIEL